MFIADPEIRMLINQYRCSSIHEQIKKKMEFYLGTKMNKIMTPISKSMDWEIIMLSKMRLTQKYKYLMFSLLCGI